jgi:hypothetical protein
LGDQIDLGLPGTPRTGEYDMLHFNYPNQMLSYQSTNNSAIIPAEKMRGDPELEALLETPEVSVVETIYTVSSNTKEIDDCLDGTRETYYGLLHPKP